MNTFFNSHPTDAVQISIIDIAGANIRLEFFDTILANKISRVVKRLFPRRNDKFRKSTRNGDFKIVKKARNGDE